MKVKNYVNKMLKEKLLQNFFILYSGVKPATFPSLLDFNPNAYPQPKLQIVERILYCTTLKNVYEKNSQSTAFHRWRPSRDSRVESGKTSGRYRELKTALRWWGMSNIRQYVRSLYGSA